MQKNKKIRKKYLFGGKIDEQTIGNVGKFALNGLTSLWGGVLGNEDLIPEFEYSGKTARGFQKANDVATTIAGKIGQVGMVVGGAALGVPPTVTTGLQNAIGGATQGISDKNNEEKMALGGYTKDQYEAEGGEVVVGKNLPKVFSGGKLIPRTTNIAKLSGKSHKEGGMIMQGGDIMFSDKLKNKKTGNTFATDADLIAKELSDLDSKLKNSDKIGRDTAKLMIDRKYKDLKNLFKDQESLKSEKTIKKFAKGGMIKYNHGGPHGDGEVGLNFNNTSGPVSEWLNPSSKINLPSMGDLPRNLGTMPPLVRNVSNLNFNNNTNNNPGSNTLRASVGDNFLLELGQNSSINPQSQLNKDGSLINKDGNTFAGDPQGYHKSDPELGNYKDLLYNGAMAAPTAYNLYQGIFGKKDYYEREVNPYMGKALEELDASKDFNINQALAKNNSSYQNTVNVAKSASGGSGGKLMTLALAGKRAKDISDRELVMERLNRLSEANRNASIARAQYGEAERAENSKEQIMKMQTDALKREMLSKGLTGISDIAQAKKLMSNQASTDESLTGVLKTLSPTFFKYYFNN